MRGNQYKIATVICLLGLVFLSASCKFRQKSTTTDGKSSPAVQVKQTIQTPTLVPQTKEAAVKSPPPVQLGPITIPPTETPPPTPAAESPPPLEMAAPMATLDDKKEGLSQKTEGGMQALAVPDIKPEEQKSQKAEEIAFQPKIVKAKTNIEIIVDASGSMSAPFGATNTIKLDMVRAALYDALTGIDSMQDEFPRNLAVRVFGSKSQASDNDKQDTELVFRMGVLDSISFDELKKPFDKLLAKGMSPIAYSLLESQKDFPDDPTADRLVVIIVDGSDNTGEDLCAMVQKIEEGTTKTTINIVAFDIKSEDQAPLECAAQKGDGTFWLARSENELRSGLEQAINSTLPYNLKLSAEAGSTPIPFALTIYKAGSQQIIKKADSFGTKLLKLEPGSYDIMVEYSASPEKRKPSKILKGVELLATTKIEQKIAFDLGQLTVSSITDEGKSFPAIYEVVKTGTDEKIATIETNVETSSYFLTPGMYNITANLLDTALEGIILQEKDIAIKLGETTSINFKFQKGTLSIKGLTTQKEAIPFTFQIFRENHTDQLVATGALSAEGGTIPLPPGRYDLIVAGADPKMMANPRTKISGVEIKASETTDLSAIFEMSSIALSAVDGQGNKLPVSFVLRDHDTQIEMATATSERGEKIQIPIPPGNYDITASSLKSKLEPRPTVPAMGIIVTADKSTDQQFKFILGTLKLRGRSVKEQPIPTQFSIYKSGTDEKISEASPANDWVVFDLAPGMYDALAVSTTSTEEPRPMIWLRDLKVEDGKSTGHEAMFTTGKLKIICRGPNNKIIACNFKVFQYGADREFINGSTTDDWEIFEIQPGRYYIEAAYHDDEQSVMLKKWISMSVSDNEVVEQVLRF